MHGLPCFPIPFYFSIHQDISHQSEITLQETVLFLSFLPMVFLEEDEADIGHMAISLMFSFFFLNILDTRRPTTLVVDPAGLLFPLGLF